LEVEHWRQVVLELAAFDVTAVNDTPGKSQHAAIDFSLKSEDLFQFPL
jgi:hypothetical protein